MAGITLKIPDVTFTGLVDKAVPHLADAAGYWIVGDGNAIRTNLVTGVAGTDVGTPVYTDAGVAISKDNGIATDITFDQNEDKTFIVVGTPASTGYAGTFHSSKSHALLQSPASPTTTVRAIMLSTGSVDVTSAVGPYRFMACTYDLAAQSQAVYGGVAGAIVSASASRLKVATPLTNTFRIGAQSVAQTGTSNVVAVMAFKAKLSSAQIGEVYDYFRFKLPRIGFSVG